MRDFFSSPIRNIDIRRTYLEAAQQFPAFCAEHDIKDLAQVGPVHVAAFVENQLRENQLREYSKLMVKPHLTALKMLFDWIVVGLVIPTNPAHAVRGTKQTQRKGRTPILTVEEARALLESIDTASRPARSGVDQPTTRSTFSTWILPCRSRMASNAP